MTWILVTVGSVLLFLALLAAVGILIGMDATRKIRLNRAPLVCVLLALFPLLLIAFYASFAVIELAPPAGVFLSFLGILSLYIIFRSHFSDKKRRDLSPEERRAENRRLARRSLRYSLYTYILYMAIMAAVCVEYSLLTVGTVDPEMIGVLILLVLCPWLPLLVIFAGPFGILLAPFAAMAAAFFATLTADLTLCVLIAFAYSLNGTLRGIRLTGLRYRDKWWYLFLLFLPLGNLIFIFRMLKKLKAVQL